MKPLPTLIACVCLVTACAGAVAQGLSVLCAGAVRAPMSALIPVWTARGGPPVDVSYAPAGEILAKLAAGARADIVILPREALAAIAQDDLGDAAARRDLGAVGIGVAVKAGAALPDISTEDGLRRALLDAKSVTFMDPTRGTSGRYVDEVVLTRLGIRDSIRAKTVLGDGGMLAERVAAGAVDLAIQQMTELMPVSGIRIAGPLPPSLQKTTVYTAALTHANHRPRASVEFLEFLVSRESQSVFAATGFTAP